VTEAIAELRQIKRGIKFNTQFVTAQNALGPPTDKAKVVEQAVLRTGQ
jgi:hypothetical protein